MSNELSTPKILVCPEDKRRKAATNFTFLTDAQLSLFLNIDTTRSNRNSLLCGDRNLTNKPVARDRFVRVTAQNPLGWDNYIHGGRGTICLADSSVAWCTNGSSTLFLTIPEGATNRHAIP